MATRSQIISWVAVFSFALLTEAFLSSCAPTVALVRPPENYKGPLAEQPVFQQGDYWVYQRGNLAKAKTTTLVRNIGFPLWIGKTWSYDSEMIRVGQPSSKAPRLPARVDCHVAAFKQVTVTAGTFEAFECECQCTHTAAGYEPGCDTWTIWYAPDVKNIIQMKTGSTETSGELIEYRASRPKEASGNTRSRESSVADPRDLLTDKYRLARSALLKNDEGHRDFAVSFFEEIVTQNPAFESAPTLLGKGYYQQGRYNDAMQILQRTLVVNKSDEIAWLVVGLTQLRLGDDQKGIASIKGGITLLHKVSTSGYRGFPNWDADKFVRQAIGRVAFQIVNLDKGSARKDDLIQSCELLLRRLDEEELAQQSETPAKGPTNKPSS